MSGNTGFFLRMGRIVFSIGMAGLGVLCFIYKDFIVGRPPAWSEGMSVNPALAYISGSILIISSLAVLFNVKGKLSALVITGLIFLLSVLRCLPNFMDHWLTAYKAISLTGGALIVAASFYAEENNNSHKKMISGLVLAGCVMLASFFITGGYSHFKYVDFVTQFIPSYIPFRSFWAYFCGVCLIAGGIGIVIPQTRRLAALLSAIMLSGWFLLLHIPRFLANTNDPSDRMGLCESFTFAGIFFVLTAIATKKK
jgi:uncharacterized membrane protein